MTFGQIYSLCNSFKECGEAKHYLKSQILKRPITEQRNEKLTIKIKL